MDHVVKILWTLAVYSASLQDMSVHGMVDFSSPWDTRVSSTLDFLQRDPCWGLSRGPKCNRSIFSNLNTRNIMLYTAETQRKLRVILPERKERRLTSDSKNNSYDAVFVLDPFPDANLGHTVFIFLLNFNVSRTVCNKSMNGLHVFTGRDECIRRAERRHCRNRSPRKINCEVNFLPLVYEKGDQLHKQRLDCRPQLDTLTFANCRARESFRHSCNPNSARCLSPTPPSRCTHKRCNHAVLVTGGWSRDTSRPRYRNNLRNVWKLLHHTMGYKKEFIVTFFGQGRKEDLAVHQRLESFPVKSSTVVSEYIRKICRSGPCVDTLTLYLTGPSTGDGSLLFWDNGDGITQDSELYSPRKLLDDIKNCSAKRVFLVADYSYSGALIDRLKKKRHPKQFSNLMAILSSSSKEPAWRSDFTHAFIKHNKQGNTTTCVADVFQRGIQPDFYAKGAKSTPQIVRSNFSSTNTTLSGHPCNEPWRNATARRPCKLLTIDEWLKQDG